MTIPAVIILLFSKCCRRNASRWNIPTRDTSFSALFVYEYTDQIMNILENTESILRRQLPHHFMRDRIGHPHHKTLCLLVEFKRYTRIDLLCRSIERVDG